MRKSHVYSYAAISRLIPAIEHLKILHELRLSSRIQADYSHTEPINMLALIARNYDYLFIIFMFTFFISAKIY